VGRQLICCTPRHEKWHMNIHDTQERSYIHSIMQTKLNKKISTEAYIVTVDDAMWHVLWTRHFLAAQGQHVPTMTIYKDNKSTILLAENGQTSSSKRTRHINICYFFIADKINKGEGCLLPHHKHARRFGYKAPYRVAYSKNAKHHIASAQHWQDWCQAQECVGEWKNEHNEHKNNTTEYQHRKRAETRQYNGTQD